MIKVKFFFPDNRELEVEGILGETLMSLAKRYNIPNIIGTCNGKLSCCSCHLLIESHKEILNNISVDEEDMLYTLAEPYPLSNSRLSCQIVLTKDLNNLIVRLI